ncbi:hypothetical protein [Rhodovulum sp. P5]|uniref:hypothetical protein n=1 Tax=Rhodovulum sp. P5 TaxID=1564506 RepID=UPI0012EC3FC8|nr:hypothetical protein [Rhodovulum sp. P5]
MEAINVRHCFSFGFLCILIAMPLPVCSANITDANVTDSFVPSGWMGDGELGGEYLILEMISGSTGQLDIDYKLTYREGPNRWAGVYWQNSANNWGEFRGEDFSGCRCVRVRAKGHSGGEIVEFKFGGIEAVGRQFKDSFFVSTGRLRLNSDWNTYVIDVSDKDLSSVIGGFAVIMTGSANEIIVIIDSVTYEMDAENCTSF